MSYSALETAANNPLANLKFIAEDTVIYLSPTGSDSLGNGSLASPYRTLAHAMTKAREFTIVGNSTLTIRLLSGEYTLTGSVDLYHPQGSNLVIEGDPAAFRQRFVYAVKNYTWSLDNFSGGGHGLTLALWDGSTTGNPNIHGLTTADNGSYFTITNAQLGCRTFFGPGLPHPATALIGGGVQNGVNTYLDTFFGDRFFNHGYSYEYSNAILGIGRIASANSSNAEIQAWTHNLGYDGRCPAWHEDGGVNNTITWGGIANNYPETQYSTPNGYYGNQAWTAAATTPNYPQKNTVPGSHITDDPIMLSTYPVVIRADYMNNTDSLYLKNGNLKALRNILFMGNTQPFVPSTGSTAGATANFSMSISTYSKQSDVYESTRDFRIRYEFNGTSVYLENANVGIRHLGFSGVGTAISCYGSRITKYSVDTITTSSGSSDQTNRHAVFGDLDNSPILCASKCQYGIVAKNSEILLSDASGLLNEYRVDRRECGVHISARQKGVVLFDSNMDVTSMWVEMSSLVPNFKMDVIIPQFPGTTVDGASAAFIRHASSNSFWNAYPRAEIFMHPAGGSEQKFGYINYVTFSSNQTPVYGTPANVSGVTTSATAFASFSPAVLPTAYGTYQIHGILTTTGGGGLLNMRSEDIWNGICGGAGGTLTMRFYSNNNAAGISSEFSLGKSGLRIRGANGQTFGLNTLAVGSDSRQLSGAALVTDYKTHGTPDTYGGEYPNNTATGVHLDDGSKLTVEKILTVNNGGCPAVYVTNQSTLCVGQGQISQSAVLSLPTYSMNSGPTNFAGALCITGYAARALEVDSSEARIGALFVKHPGALNPDPIYQFESGGASVPPLGRALHATHNSRVFLNEMFVLGLPGHRNVYGNFGTVGTGLFSSRTAKYGYNAPRLQGTNIVQYTRIENSIVYADNASSVLLGVNGLANSNFYTFAFDGGTADFTSGAITNTAAYRNCSIFAADSQSHILVSNVGQRGVGNPLGSAATNILLSGREIADSRVGNNQTIATRGRNNVANITVYNTTGVTRAWLGPENYTTTVTPNVGTSSGVTNVVYHPLVILTPSVSITGNNYGSHVTTQAGRYDYLSVVSFAAGDKIHSATNEYGQVDVQYISR